MFVYLNIYSFYKFIENDLLRMSKGCLVTMEPIEIKLLKPEKKYIYA